MHTLYPRRRESDPTRPLNFSTITAPIKTQTPPYSVEPEHYSHTLCTAFLQIKSVSFETSIVDACRSAFIRIAPLPLPTHKVVEVPEADATPAPEPAVDAAPAEDGATGA